MVVVCLREKYIAVARSALVDLVAQVPHLNEALGQASVELLARPSVVAYDDLYVFSALLAKLRDELGAVFVVGGDEDRELHFLK